MIKHTAGPWSYWQGAGAGDESHAEITSKDGDIVVAAFNDMIPDGEANARLIAAAPDLLEALMMARDALATALRTAAPDWFETKEDIDAHVGINQIDAAIAKATGEAQ